MQQSKKLIIETIQSQQQKIINKTKNELVQLELAVDDKKLQLELQIKLMESIS